VYGSPRGPHADSPLRQAVQRCCRPPGPWAIPARCPAPAARVDRSARRALQGIHAPTDRQPAQGPGTACVFDELLVAAAEPACNRLASNDQPSHTSPFGAASASQGSLGGGLPGPCFPFRSQSAQRAVLAEIRRPDLVRSRPWPVCCKATSAAGKTVWVAIAALLTANRGGVGQACLIGLPPRCWPKQHARKSGEWLPRCTSSTALLTGSTPRPRRQDLLFAGSGQRVSEAAGRTHAFARSHGAVRPSLAWWLVDEQHRVSAAAPAQPACLARDSSPICSNDDGHPDSRTHGPLACMGSGGESDRTNWPPVRTPVCTQLLRGMSTGSQAYQLIRRSTVALGLRGYVVLALVGGIRNPGPALSGGGFTTSSAARLLATLRVGLCDGPHWTRRQSRQAHSPPSLAAHR